MEWYLKRGGKANEAFYKVFEENEGYPHPATLLRTELPNNCFRYYDAFRMLGSARTWSEIGPCPIPISEIAAYLNICNVTDELTKLKYVRLIQRMDRIELDYIYASRKK